METRAPTCEPADRPCPADGTDSGAGTDANEPARGNYFVAAYPPFSQWSVEGVDQFRQRLAAPQAPGNEVPLGLYVHIPFCTERCQYCYYLSSAHRTRDQIDAYLDALIAEAALYARAPAVRGRSLDFVYFGGGTPSVLSPPRIRRLLKGLADSLSCQEVREVSFECAPRTVTLAKLGELRNSGVTRLSLGVQQLDDAVLARNGRIHLIHDVDRAYADIRRVGFDVVNLDLMVGLVGETDESFHRSLERVVGMAPDSVTIYQLEIPANTPLAQAIRDGTLDAPVPSWALKRARLEAGFARLERAGYTLRSAYAAVRDLDRQPFLYMDEQYRGADLLGLGVSAFSYLNGVHHQNLARFEPYVEQVTRGTLPFGRAHALDDDERVIREFVLQLKLGKVELAYFRDRHRVEVRERFAEPLARCTARGWLHVGADRITLTRPGLLRVDQMIPSFYSARHRDAPYC
ncbi:MAG: coproporphyrinogen-III oxidase family protein [Vicinamibacterales bacterium]|nr:coproporphyrinogen-III oxidase family protein [Vicinamibacterales bacterium]MDP7692489.1 coproporphyrinogen-III oxidase family protein [Vicinamibacterales bacterium]